MFNNLIKQSLRSFKRQRAYIIINVLGLSIGIACSLVIAFLVIKEVSYDRYNEKKARIFRLVFNSKIGGQDVISPLTAPNIGPTMLKEFPEIEDFLRINKRESLTVRYNDKLFTEDHLIEADSSFFNFFSIQVIKGDPENFLSSPRKIVLSLSTAKRIFGDGNPIDKILLIGSDTTEYTVSGVMADIPENSHFEANIISSSMSNPWSVETAWLNNSVSTYLLLKPNTNYRTVNDKMTDLLFRHVSPELQNVGVSFADFLSQGNIYRIYLQNLTDIHLDPSVQQQYKEAGDPKYLNIFGTIAILIIIIAAINYMNLSTAKASRRAKEVGIKKISGSSKGMLIVQFLSESFILTIISLGFAIILIKLLLPYFNNLLGINLAFDLFTRWYIVPALILFSVIVAMLAGSYPAFCLSSFSPYEILKGNVKNSLQHGRLRRILVVFQFTVSILLIVGTIIMYRQIKYMLKKDVGFNREQLIVINGADALQAKAKSFKELVKVIPGVINIASSTSVPGRNNTNQAYLLEGRKDETVMMAVNWIDSEYLKIFGISLVEGRSFNESYTTDKDACLINEAAVKDFSINNIEKARFMMPLNDGKMEFFQVIGVVKNFNFESLHRPIGPYIFRFVPNDFFGGFLTLKISGQNYQKIINNIENVWKDYVPDKELKYYFVDEDFKQMYIRERQNAQIALIFSILAIFIASLGLSGLTSFTVEQRTREIGVRKAMGSSVTGIYYTITKEVIILIFASAFIACPIIYYVAVKWLENFHYRIHPEVSNFVVGFSIALGIAVLTISYRILRAARVNPAQALKYE